MTTQYILGESGLWLPEIFLGNAAQGPAASTVVTVDATGEYLHITGRVQWSDRGSHTIDTTGGSALGWMTGTSTFADAGTTLRIGIQDTAEAGANPARGDGTFDVYADLVGGTDTVAANTWYDTPMESGTKTMAHGAIVTVVIGMTARGGSDAVQIRCSPMAIAIESPVVALETSGPTFTAQTATANIKLVASDGTIGWIAGGFPTVTTALVAQSYDNNDATKEYGNIIRVPGPVALGSLWAVMSPTSSVLADSKLIVYSDPFAAGSGPTEEASVTILGDQVFSTGGSRLGIWRLASDFTLAKDTDYAIVLSPSTTNAISLGYFDMAAAGDMAMHSMGTNCYGVSRGTIGAGTAFAAISSGIRRFMCGVGVIGIDDGAGGGGGIRLAGHGGLAA